MKSNLNIGNKFRQIRKELDITQPALAKKLNVTPGYISKYERNVILPSIKILIKLSKFFKISLDELFLEQAIIKTKSKINPELLKKLEKIAALTEEDQKTINTYLDGFLARN